MDIKGGNMAKKPKREPLFYRIQECADMLAVDYRYIYDRIQSGEIPHVRLSTKMIRIPIKAFHKWCGLD